MRALLPVALMALALAGCGARSWPEQAQAQTLKTELAAANARADAAEKRASAAEARADAVVQAKDSEAVRRLSRAQAAADAEQKAADAAARRSFDAHLTDNDGMRAAGKTQGQ